VLYGSGGVVVDDGGGRDTTHDQGGDCDSFEHNVTPDREWLRDEQKYMRNF
jgi:hypothetical protein